jgi:hypothetical protein
MAEPTYFRSTLMLAGLHYMWKVGAFQEFEKSVLFHKQQLIQLVNSWLLGDVSLITSKQLKLIAILSIAEVCTVLKTKIALTNSCRAVLETILWPRLTSLASYL